MRSETLECELNMTSNAYSCELTVEEENEQEIEKVIDCQTEIERLSLIKEVVPKRFSRVVYPKNSFDRFGDDLTELILQYLIFEDKVRLECVSKQWRRLVFNKQFAFDIKYFDRLNGYENENSFEKLIIKKEYEGIDPMIGHNKQVLKSVLKKCPNISRVKLTEEKSYEDWYLITKYCRRVTKLLVSKDCEVKALMSFAAKHGMWLQEIAFDHYDHYISYCMRSFLDMCPNIRKIDFNLGWSLTAISDKLVNISLNKLQVIRGFYIRGDNESNGLKNLFNNYGKSLKELKIMFIDMSSDELKTCFAHISRFESLESLKLEINCYMKEPIDECLKLLAKKCTKLRELRFKAIICKMTNKIFFSFSEFRSLQKLIIDFDTKRTLNGNVECLKHMTRLKHLSITYSRLTLHFFANIHRILPNIQYLDINTDHNFGQSLKPFIESLQCMKCIERMIISEELEFYYYKNRSESKPRIVSKAVIYRKEYLNNTEIFNIIKIKFR